LDKIATRAWMDIMDDGCCVIKLLTMMNALLVVNTVQTMTNAVLVVSTVQTMTMTDVVNTDIFI
jgi:hypothetical protein